LFDLVDERLAVGCGVAGVLLLDDTDFHLSVCE
jgi:hypothetical protein